MGTRGRQDVGWLAMRLVELLIAVALIALVYRLIAGPVRTELLGIEIRMRHFRNPLLLLVLLLALRALLPKAELRLRQIRDGLERTRVPVRATLLLTAMAIASFWTLRDARDYNSSRFFWESPAAFWLSSEAMLVGDHIEELGPLMNEVRRHVPEHGAAFLETDERPYFLNYYLYPRRLYRHPEIAEALDRSNTYAPELRFEVHPHDDGEACPVLAKRPVEWRIRYFRERERNRVVRSWMPQLASDGHVR